MINITLYSLAVAISLPLNIAVSVRNPSAIINNLTLDGNRGNKKKAFLIENWFIK